MARVVVLVSVGGSGSVARSTMPAASSSIPLMRAPIYDGNLSLIWCRE